MKEEHEHYDWNQEMDAMPFGNLHSLQRECQKHNLCWRELHFVREKYIVLWQEKFWLWVVGKQSNIQIL